MVQEALDEDVLFLACYEADGFFVGVEVVGDVSELVLEGSSLIAGGGVEIAGVFEEVEDDAAEGLEE